MRVVFVGASAFGLRCLERLLQLDSCQVVGVVTAPARFAISYSVGPVTNVRHADIHSAASARGLPVRMLRDRMTDRDLFENVVAWAPQAFVVAGWYHLLPKMWRTVAPAYGLHASLLPDYRGGAPLVWALINGETRTGITLFQMDDGVDTGPIVDQIDISISDADTIATLCARVDQVGPGLLARGINSLEAGTVAFRAQNPSQGRVFPQRSPDDGLIDWNTGQVAVRNFIRAQTRPYPGAFTVLENDRLTVWDCEVFHTLEPLAPGQLSVVDGRMCVGCSGGAVAVTDLDVNGVTVDPAVWARALSRITLTPRFAR